ncbi:hypothetical protein E1265_05715 [Streptomyces sp. 8K308]|uniref:hypothetical protein n=1 Tax=Streptomyces sp. 8K308 TaxID=2530388 RepID=UPI00104CF6D4|nr:hypothetical protein [Streptomyces sp. 8K308]TDC25875.1 hypothetical protein E1265_05715 [Streptomyces sp. 8K308]
MLGAGPDDLPDGLTGRDPYGRRPSGTLAAELRQRVELNADDLEFARVLLDDLGADGLLRMTVRIGTVPPLPRLQAP